MRKEKKCLDLTDPKYWENLSKYWCHHLCPKRIDIIGICTTTSLNTRDSKPGDVLQAVRKNGEEFPVEISLADLSVRGNRFVLAAVEDISEKNDIEQQLQESEHKLASIIENAVDGIITIDDQGYMLTVNPSAAKLFGYEESEMIGQNINLLMPHPHHAMHNSYIENYKQGGKPKIIGIGREVVGKRKNGTQFPFYLSVSEVKLRGKKIFTGIVHDLTEQKKAELQLKRYSLELEKRVQARTRALAQAMEGMENEIRGAERN